MKKLAIFFFLFIISCSEDRNTMVEIPTIPEKDMIALIYDFALSDAYVENQMLETNKLIYQKKLTFYTNILEEHGYTEEEFKQSFEAYSQDLTLLGSLYDSVLVRLSTNEIELNINTNE